MVKDHSDSERGNSLPPHGLLFLISSKGSFIAPSHKQDNTYHSLCYTSQGTLAGTRNSSMGPQWRIDPMTHCTMSECSYHRAISHSWQGLMPQLMHQMETTTEKMKENTYCCHFISYSSWLAARDLLFAPSNRQYSTYHGLCFTICRALAGIRSISVGSPGGIDLMTLCTTSYTHSQMCINVHMYAWTLHMLSNLGQLITITKKCPDKMNILFLPLSAW